MALQLNDRRKSVCAAVITLSVLLLATATSGAIGQSLKHDSNERLTETVYPDGKSKRFVYDSAGNLRQVLTTTSGSGSQGKLPHSGITSAQCYQAGFNTLVACSSAGAIALSGAGKQDGMLANVNAMSYSSVGSYSKEECVKDNITGLMWEGKTASGTRAGSNRYTNYGDGRSGDASAYVAAVNALILCGLNDWRMPTVDELRSIVDYSKPSPGPTINSTWFPNTASGFYWSSSPFAIRSDLAWYVDFDDGVDDFDGRYGTSQVRLVRASQ